MGRGLILKLSEAILAAPSCGAVHSQPKTLLSFSKVKTKAGRDQKVVLDRLSDDLSQAKADIGRAVEESKESITTALVDTVDVVVDTTLLLKVLAVLNTFNSDRNLN